MRLWPAVSTPAPARCRTHAADRGPQARIRLLAAVAFVIAATAGGGAFVEPAHAGAPGSPDTAFNYRFTLNKLSYSVRVMVIQSDTKIVIGGDFADGLKRFNADGTPDVAFNTNVAAASLIDGAIYAIAVQSDGAIVVGGAFTGRLKRYATDGSPDTTFNTNVTSTTVFSINYPNSVALQTDGKILVGGSFPGRLARFETNGTADTTNLARMLVPSRQRISTPPSSM